MSKTATIVHEEEEEDDAIPLELESGEEDPVPVAKPKARQVASKSAPLAKAKVVPPKPKAKKRVEVEEEAKAPKKKAKKVAPPQPAPIEEEPPVEKKKREKHAPRAHGNRFGNAPAYRTQLAKDRAKRREEQIKAGKVPAAVRRSKPGSVARREAEHLQKSNGLYITTAYTRRQIDKALAKWIPIIQKDKQRVKDRATARGKPVPAHLEVPDARFWSKSQEFVQHCRAVLQVCGVEHGELAGKLKDHAKRVTLNGTDTLLAHKIMPILQ